MLIGTDVASKGLDFPDVQVREYVGEYVSEYVSEYVGCSTECVSADGATLYLPLGSKCSTSTLTLTLTLAPQPWP